MVKIPVCDTYSKLIIGVTVLAIEKYLDDLESRIDTSIEDDFFDRWKDFTDGKLKEGFFYPKRGRQSPPNIPWPQVTVNQAFDDFEKMALQQFGICSRILSDDDGRFLAVRCNYGTSIIPSLFGAKLFMMDESANTLPTSWPLEGGADTIKTLLDRGTPDLDTTLGAKTFEMGRRFADIMKSYPKISKYVHIYHPDMQGPMDICELLWGSSIFMALIETPQLVKDFLSLITDTYIRFMKQWQQIAPAEGDYTVHWHMLHKGTVAIRNDSSTNLSPQMYAEFALPNDQKILDEFGGGMVHFCGRGEHLIPILSEMNGVHAINISQPDYNDMEIIFKNTVDKDIRLIGLLKEVADEAVKTGRDLKGNVHCLEKSAT